MQSDNDLKSINQLEESKWEINIHIIEKFLQHFENLIDPSHFDSGLSECIDFLRIEIERLQEIQYEK